MEYIILGLVAWNLLITINYLTTETQDKKLRKLFEKFVKSVGGEVYYYTENAISYPLKKLTDNWIDLLTVIRREESGQFDHSDLHSFAKKLGYEYTTQTNTGWRKIKVGRPRKK